MRRYKVLLPLQVQPREGGSYKQHEEFDAELTEDEETENVRSGLLAIVPQQYKVVGDWDVYETPTGEVFERALPLGEEALLLGSGHIERVKRPAQPNKKG